MQDGKELLSVLHRQGVRLRVENGQLRFQAPRGVIGPVEVEELRLHKAELIHLLEERALLERIPPAQRLPGRQIPLTPMQVEWVRYVNEHQAGASERLCYISMRLEGSLDRESLKASIAVLVRRHEPLRTKLALVDGSLGQEIIADNRFDFTVADFSHLAAADARHQANSLCGHFVTEKIKLLDTALFATKLIRISEAGHILVLASEHSITDGGSETILYNDLWTLYALAIRKQPLELPELSLQFADFAIWLKTTHRAWLEAHAPYWEERLRDVLPTTLPLEERVPSSANSSYATETFRFGDRLSNSLRELARQEKTLVAMVALAVYVSAMSHWCRLRDLVVLFASNSRLREELREVVGFLTNHLPLRFKISETDNFRSVLNQVRRELEQAYAHNDFERVPTLIPDYRTELYFNWQSADAMPITKEILSGTPQQLTVRPFALDVSWPRDFLPMFFDIETDIVMTLTYRRDLVTESVVADFGECVLAFAKRCSESPHLSVTALER